MKVKRMVKRLLAIGTGATMLGATVMGAMAADLSNYPSMFVTGGNYNGFFVVGEAAAAVDNLAMTDIATGMMTEGTTSGSTTSVTGDSWLVKSGTDVLEIGEAIGPSTGGVVSFLDGEDLGALSDGVLKNSKGSYDYEQFLHFDTNRVNVTYAQDDDDVLALFVHAADNFQIARYALEFTQAAKSDIDASASYELKDYENKEITLLGKTYDIVKAVWGGASANYKVSLTLMAGSVHDTLTEGESMTYSIGGKDYDVELLFTDSANRAKFVVNGETTSLLDESETTTLLDGTVLGLSEVLYQDYAGGIHSAEFFLGADKLDLEDDDITVGTSTDELKINEETIDGADVFIKGTLNDNATSSTEDGELEIDSIEVNMTAQDDLYVAAGEKLSEQPELEEVDLLFTQNWDIQFTGLSEEVVNVISVKDTNSEKEYELTFTNVNGEVIKMPFVYASAASSMRLGDSDDNLTLNKSLIVDEQYFILNDDTDEDSVTNVVQYKGANVGSDSTTLKFKILGSGETIEKTWGSSNSTTLKLGGTTYTIADVATYSGARADDFAIQVSAGAAATATHGAGNDDRFTDYLIAKGGAKIAILGENSTAATNGQIQFNVSLIDADRIDDVVSGVTTAAPYLVKGFNVTVSSQKLDLATETGLALASPDDNDDVNYGYSANGAFISLTSPTGSTSADTLEIDWPEDERVPLVYVTSGATATVSKGKGGMVPVTVVDATRLDSEISNANAQNLIVVGGPCVNTVAAELMGNPSDCTADFTPGKSLVKLWQHANGNYAMLVAGYSGADTRLAGRVLANTPEKVTGVGGMEVVVEGTTTNDATVAAPSAMSDTTTQ